MHRMVQLESPKSQFSKTFFCIENLLNIKEKHVCVYFEPLINLTDILDFSFSLPLLICHLVSSLSQRVVEEVVLW